MMGDFPAGPHADFVPPDFVFPGLGIYGVGTDICDIRRIAAALERHGLRLVQRVLSVHEQAVWQARTQRHPERGVRYLATRFSAKEAVSKALGLGMRMPMSWRLCEIANAPSGAPLLRAHGPLREWMAARGLHAHISLSDEGDYALSFCVMLRCAGAGEKGGQGAATVPG